MHLLRFLIAAACLSCTSAAFAADKTAAKTPDKTAGKTADKGAADKGKVEKATPVGDMPTPPPRLTYQGLKGQPGLANYENLQGKVPADKYDVVTKALADAKLPALISLYSALRSAHEAAAKADVETSTAEKDAERDKVKVDKLQAEADKTKGNYRLRYENSKANAQLKDAKEEADRTDKTLKKRQDEAKATHDAFATAKSAYEKALSEAQPAIDTFRKEGGIPEGK